MRVREEEKEKEEHIPSVAGEGERIGAVAVELARCWCEDEPAEAQWPCWCEDEPAEEPSTSSISWGRPGESLQFGGRAFNPGSYSSPRLRLWSVTQEERPRRDGDW